MIRTILRHWSIVLLEFIADLYFTIWYNCYAVSKYDDLPWFAIGNLIIVYLLLLIMVIRTVETIAIQKYGKK